jgi:hypothetical protein
LTKKGADMAAVADALVPLDSLTVDVLSDNVSDTYVSKTPFARTELANVVSAGATVISGHSLLLANLGYGLRLTSRAGSSEHVMLFDTGPEAAVFMRNCTNLGIGLGAVEEIAISHGHWDHMGALNDVIDAIVAKGGSVSVHVNPPLPGHPDTRCDGRFAPRRRDGADYQRDGGRLGAVRDSPHYRRALHGLAGCSCPRGRVR